MPPHERRPEGPFGDHYGYYSLRHDYPVFEVQRWAHRRDAVFLDDGHVLGEVASGQQAAVDIRMDVQVGRQLGEQGGDTARGQLDSEVGQPGGPRRVAGTELVDISDKCRAALGAVAFP